jgi:hypothetical protein
MSTAVQEPSKATRRLALILAVAVLVGILLRIPGEPLLKGHEFDRASIVTAARMVAADPTAYPAEQGTAPGYALVLAALAKTSTAATNGLLCLATPTATCTQAPFLVLVNRAQMVLELVALALVALIAHVLSGSASVAILTAAIAYWGARYGDFVAVLGDYVAYHAASHAFVAAIVLAASRSNAVYWLAGGTMLAAMTAFEPISLVVAPVVLLLIGWPPANCEATSRQRMFAMLSFVCGCGGALAVLIEVGRHIGCPPDSWIGHVARQMAERAAFNAIDLPTWLTGIIRPVPFLGPLATLLAPEASLTKLGKDAPGTFVFIGATEIRALAMAAGRDGTAQLLWLLDKYLVRDLVGYAVSLPIVLWRGLWAGVRILSLAGLFHVPRLVQWSAVDGRVGLLVMAAAPALALLVANAALTSNLFVLNPLLPTLFAYAIAYVARGV